MARLKVEAEAAGVAQEFSVQLLTKLPTEKEKSVGADLEDHA
jgi:hypothetical protein